MRYKFQVDSSDQGYNFNILDANGEIVGIANVESKHDQKGKFWHLENLLIEENNRNQGYGTALINYLRDYLWSIERLRIRVHPAVGRQAFEDLAKQASLYQQQYTEEELDEMDRRLREEMKQPDFWERQAEIGNSYTSDSLMQWYKDRGFTVVDYSDERHCWCLPS